MEFWARSATHRVRDDERFFVKQGSSAAHTYGKTLVAAEGMTSIGPQWEESIWRNLKPTFDQAVCEGLNRLYWHTFTSSPKSAGLPGQEYFAGTHLNPNVTWWSKAGAFVSYINRTQFLMQQGVPVSDVLVYYGDNVPNFVQWKGADPAKVLPGYDYDVVDERALAERTSVKDGRIVLPEGTSYRVLVLPDRPSMSLSAVKAVARLVKDGATVIGPKPVRTTGIGDDAEVRRIADEVWGRVHAGVAARSLLGVPDFEGPAETEYVHRRAGETEIYFVRSNRPEAVGAEVTLRVAGKVPELWHPDTGGIEDAAGWEFTSDGRTRLKLELEPNGSVFVVFRRAAAAGKIAPARGAGPAPVAVSGPWTVRFTPGWGAPESVSFEKLSSWTESMDPGIRYYAGTARYSTRFDVPAGREWTLDLGDVREIAEVWVNGKSLGVLWKPPFAVSLGKVSGPVELQVEVVNLWPNRIIGDLQPGIEKRYASTNITKFTASSELMPSGLLGPVVLRGASSSPAKASVPR
jgi:hypothetical protein